MIDGDINALGVFFCAFLKEGRKMKKFNYVIKDQLGIHARPAGMLVKEVKNYEAKVTLKKADKQVDASKIMAVMGLGIKCGETITVEVSGADEEAACAGLEAFFKENL